MQCGVLDISEEGEDFLTERYITTDRECVCVNAQYIVSFLGKGVAKKDPSDSSGHKFSFVLSDGDEAQATKDL